MAGALKRSESKSFEMGENWKSDDAVEAGDEDVAFLTAGIGNRLYERTGRRCGRSRGNPMASVKSSLTVPGCLLPSLFSFLRSLLAVVPVSGGGGIGEGRIGLVAGACNGNRILQWALFLISQFDSDKKCKRLRPCWKYCEGLLRTGRDCASSGAILVALLPSSL